MKKSQIAFDLTQTTTDETKTTFTGPKIKTPYNNHLHPKGTEKNIGVSLTIPDQTLSVKEIMQRFASGLPVEGHEVSFFEEEDPLDGIDFQKLDLSERQLYIQQFQEELNQLAQKAAWKKSEADKKSIEESKALETDPTKPII